MSWHLERDAVARYDAGLADRVASASIEAHLERCAGCRGHIEVDDMWLERQWEAVAGLVYAPTTTRAEKLLVKLGVSGEHARLLVVTPSLKPAWLIAVAAAMVFAALASQIGSGRFDLFLAVAPLVPVLGVAFAYGRRGDPAHEILVSSPMDPVRLLLMRVAVVTFTALVLAVVADVVTRGTRGFGVWLLPTLALVATTLALGTRISLWSASMVSVGAWVGFLVAASVGPDVSTAGLLGGSTQVGFVALVVVAVSVFKHRLDYYRTGGV